MPSESPTTALGRAVEADHGWRRDEFELQPLADIQLAGCAFFTATHRRLPMHLPPTYAVLTDGRVLGDGDPQACGQILAACATAPAPASAASLAEVFARFHREVGPGQVLRDRSQAPAAIGRMEASGRAFTPPTLVTEQGVSSLNFLLMNFDADLLYEVRATQRPGGTWEVQRTRLNPR